MKSFAAVRSTNRAFIGLLTLLGGVVMIIPIEAQAQQKTVALEEIVVTARIWEEKLQDIPATVTAIDGIQAERAGVQSVVDIAALTPGLTFVSLQGSNYALPVIRGLSTNVGESNVGFFLDGVYLGSRSGMDRLLTDIERVEVIKGPQVALYGRNTFAGAINVITRAPTNDLQTSVALTYGSSDLIEARGTVSGPLLEDRLFFRLGAAYSDHDGFYDNELTGQPLDDRNSQAYAGMLSWKPTTAFSLDLRAVIDRTRNGDNVGYFTFNNSQPPFNGRSQIYLGEVPSKTSGFAVAPGGFDRDSTMLALVADWSLSDEYTLTSITSYFDFSSEFRADIDYGPTNVSYLTQLNDQQEFSQELRLAATKDGWSWLAGLFYIKTDDRIRDLDRADPAYENLLPGSQRSVFVDNSQETENVAVFGSVDWRFATNWELSLAGRYFREKKSIDPYQENPYTGVFLNPNPSLSKSDTFFTPSLALRWQFADGKMVYGSVVRGVKAGGFNALANVTASERTFDAESSWNYEIGAKTGWLDGRVQLNGAIFYIDWKDQIVRALGVNNATLNANAGTTTSKGLETEVQVQMTENLRVAASYAYTDAKFDEYIFPALRLSFGLEDNLAGNELQYVSRNVATLTADYQAAISATTNLFVRGDLAYRSRQYGSTTNLYWVGDSTKVNAVIGFERGAYSLEFWARNLLDDETPTVSVSQRDRASIVLPPSGQGVFKTLAFAPNPRSYGVTLRARF